MNLLEIDGVKYEITEALSTQGQQGFVRRGVNVFTKEEVIIKQQNELSEQEKNVLNILIQHQPLDNIIQIKGYQIQNNKVIIVMEHGGQDLQNYLNKNRNKLSKQQLMNIFLQIVKGVKEFHELNFIHRDLKPQNFAINDKEVIKLIDFGTSRDDSGREKTQGVGSTCYAAPETYSNQYDISVDIWSIGCILYELLTQEEFIKKINFENQSQINQKIEKSKLEQNEKFLLQQMLQVVPEQRSKIQIIFEAIQIFKTQQQQYLQTTFIKGSENLQEPNVSQFGRNQINVGGQLYQTTQIIGRGAQGAVYKGISLQTGEVVAIKTQNSMTEMEYKLLQDLQVKPQKHIIGIKVVQKDFKGVVTIIMELADQELYQYIASNPEYQLLTKHQKNQVFLQMAKSVQELNQLGYLHRDLKPENFVVFKKDQNGFVKTKLIDLGLAKQQQSLTQTKKIGTPYYMAPEIINDAHEYDQSVDVWALGCIWFEMLTTQTFIQGTTQKQLMHNIKLFTQADIDSKVNSTLQLSQKEKYLIKKLIKKTPSERLPVSILVQYLESKEENPAELEKLIQHLMKDQIQNFWQPSRQNIQAFQIPQNQQFQPQNINNALPQNQPIINQKNPQFKQFQPQPQNVNNIAQNQQPILNMNNAAPPIQPMANPFLQNYQQIQNVSNIVPPKPVQNFPNQNLFPNQISNNQNTNFQNQWMKQEIKPEISQGIKQDYNDDTVQNDQKLKNELQNIQQEHINQQIKIKFIEDEFQKKNAQLEKKKEDDRRREVQQKKDQEEFQRKEQERIKKQKEEEQKKFDEQQKQKQQQELEEKQKQEQQEKERQFLEMKNRVLNEMKILKGYTEQFIQNLEEKFSECNQNKSSTSQLKEYQQYENLVSIYLGQNKQKLEDVTNEEIKVQKINLISDSNIILEVEKKINQELSQIVSSQGQIYSEIDKKWKQVENLQQIQKQQKEQQDLLITQLKQQVVICKQQYDAVLQSIQNQIYKFQIQMNSIDASISQFQEQRYLQKANQIKQNSYRVIQSTNQIKMQFNDQFHNQEFQTQKILYSQQTQQLIKYNEELNQLVQQQFQLNMDIEQYNKDFKFKASVQIQQFEEDVSKYSKALESHYDQKDNNQKLLYEMQEIYDQFKKVLLNFKTLYGKDYIQSQEYSNLNNQLNQYVKELEDKDIKLINYFNEQNKILQLQTKLKDLNDQAIYNMNSRKKTQMILYQQLNGFSSISVGTKNQIDLFQKNYDETTQMYLNEIKQLQQQSQTSLLDLENQQQQYSRIIRKFQEKCDEIEEGAQKLLLMLHDLKKEQDLKQSYYNQFNCALSQIKQALKGLNFKPNFNVYGQLLQFRVQYEEILEKQKNHFQKCFQFFQENFQIYKSLKQASKNQNQYNDNFKDMQENLERMYDKMFHKSQKRIQDFKEFFSTIEKQFSKIKFEGSIEEYVEVNQYWEQALEAQLTLEKINEDVINSYERSQIDQNFTQDFIFQIERNLEIFEKLKLNLQTIQQHQIKKFNQCLEQNQDSLRQLMLSTTAISIFLTKQYYQRKISFLEGRTKFLKEFDDQKEQSNINALLQKYQDSFDRKQFMSCTNDQIHNHQIQIEQQKQKVLNDINTRNRLKLRAVIKDQNLVKEIISLGKFQEFCGFIIYSMIVQAYRKTKVV